jgi:Tripartite tricarboxylate transporter TctB family
LASSDSAAGWRADAYPGLVVLAMGVVVVVISRAIEYRQIIANDPLTPASVPTALGVLLVLSGAVLVGRGLLRRRAEPGDPGTPADGVADRRGWWQVAAAVAACVVFAVLLPMVGFAFAAPLLMLAVTTVAAGAERLALAVSLAIAVPAVCFLVFSELLDLPIQLLPTAG